MIFIKHENGRFKEENYKGINFDEDGNLRIDICQENLQLKNFHANNNRSISKVILTVSKPEIIINTSIEDIVSKIEAIEGCFGIENLRIEKNEESTSPYISLPIDEYLQKVASIKEYKIPILGEQTFLNLQGNIPRKEEHASNVCNVITHS